MPQHDKFSFPVLATDVGEPEKVEGFRLALAPLLTIFGCKKPEFDEAGTEFLVSPEFLQMLDHSISSNRFSLDVVSI